MSHSFIRIADTTYYNTASSLLQGPLSPASALSSNFNVLITWRLQCTGDVYEACCACHRCTKPLITVPAPEPLAHPQPGAALALSLFNFSLACGSLQLPLPGAAP